jgi:hypothetical protein
MADVIAMIQSTISAVQATLSAVGIASGQAAAMAAIPPLAIEARGIGEVIVGIGQVIYGSITSITYIVPDLFDAIYTFVVFAITWMLCLFKNIANMQTCLFYYLIDTVGQILYLPFRIIFWLCYMVKLDLYPAEKSIWDMIEDVDRVFIKNVGFHICHWPKSIRDQCYNCKRLKVSTLNRHSAPLVHDINHHVPRLLKPGFDRVSSGADKMLNPFQ